MADELFEGEKYMAERRADFERSEAEREIRLEILDEKLQETIAEVKLTARKLPKEASEAFEIDLDDDFAATAVGTADNVPPTSTPSLKATAPPLSSGDTDSPARVGVPADFLLRTVAANTVRSLSDASIVPKTFTGKTE
jgi:ParB-like chromosome segregation protein Spo0J